MRAFRVAYDGRLYHGFQRQPDVQTIEGTIFDALRTLGVFPEDADKPTGYAAAGRTDAGVSAVAQTVAFECPAWLSPAALNSELPADVRAWASADVADAFHATHAATSRTYVYYLHAPSTDQERVRAALDRLSGTHDFHNLTPDDGNTRRSLEARVERDGPFLVITLSAPGFSRQLVRRIVSLARGVGAGELDLDAVDRALSPEPLSGPNGIAPAPATPLVLVDVAYPGVTFGVDSEAHRSARRVFTALEIDRLTGARVAGTVIDWLGDARP